MKPESKEKEYVIYDETIDYLGVLHDTDKKIGDSVEAKNFVTGETRIFLIVGEL